MTEPKKVKVEIEVSIYPKESMFLRHHVGDGECTTGKFQVSATVNDMSPIVHLPEGHQVHFDWQALIAAAIAATQKP